MKEVCKGPGHGASTFYHAHPDLDKGGLEFLNNYFISHPHTCTSLQKRKYVFHTESIVLPVTSLVPNMSQGAYGYFHFYPARACAARGKVISRGWWCP